MKVPVLVAPRISAKIAPSIYSRAGDAFPRTSGLEQGLNMAAEIAFRKEKENEQAAEKLKTERDQAKKFQAVTAFTAYEGNAKLRQQELRKNIPVGQLAASDPLLEDFEKETAKFISTLDPDMQIELGPRVEALRQNTRLEASAFEFQHTTKFYSTELDKLHEQSKVLVGADATPETLVMQQVKMFEAIDRSGLSPVDKAAKKDIVARELQTIAYKAAVQKNGTLGPGTGKVEPGSAADEIVKLSKEVGADDSFALDLATLISYETAGTFSTGIVGGKDNLYMGLIQFGPEERAKYGVTGKETFKEQLQQVKAFLVDRGWKPGMGLLDMYSIVNAGSPGLYNASDGPGNTVRTHVDKMLNGPHRAKAAALLAGAIDVDALDKDPTFAAVSYEDRVAAVKDGLTNAVAEETARRKADENQYQQNYNSLLIKLNDGAAGEVELENFRETNPGMSFDEINKAQTILANRNKDGQLLADANAFIRSGGVFDPTESDHKKFADALVGKEGIAAITSGDKGYVANTLLPLVQRTGMVPPSVAGTLEGMLRTNNAQQNLYALDTLGQLRDTYPKAFDALPPKINNDLDLWNTAKNYMDQKELIQLIRGAPSAEQRQAQLTLRDEARRKLTVPTDPDFVSFDTVIDTFSGWTDMFRGGTPNVQGMADAKAMMRAEFNGLFEYEYTIDGNAEAATERASRQLQRMWGTTRVGGIPHIMKYPVETQYRPVLGDHSWIDKQVRTELKLDPGESWVPVGDGQTHNEVLRNKNAAAGRPDPSAPVSYQIIRVKDGLPRAAVGEDGKPLRMFFEIPKELKEVEQATFNYEHQKAINDMLAREISAMTDDGVRPTEQALQALKTRAAQLKVLKDRLDGLTKKPLPMPATGRRGSERGSNANP